MRKVRPFYLPFIALLLVSATWGASVSAVLERSNIMVGETTSLQVIIEDGAAQSLGTFQNTPGLNVQFLGRQDQVNMVNGRRSQRQILNFNLSASQPGEYTIPAVPVVISGQQQSTEPLQLTVTKSEVPPESPYAFARLIVPKEEMYVGEIVPIEVQLYLAGRGEQLQAPTLKGDGFVINKRANHALANTQVGNIPYNVASFKMAVSPAKAGQLELGPAEISFVMLVPMQRNPNDLLGGFFGRYQRREVTLKSPSRKVNVRPLPRENVPGGFTGAIGQFNWQVSSSPTNLNAGDPITLKVQVAGKGNWDSVKLPELKWPGFKAYAPNSTVESNDPLGISGEKHFEQVIVPEHSGITKIPSLEFAFFNPAEKSYRTLHAPETPITVRSTGAPQVQPSLANAPLAPSEEELPPNDIVHIKPFPGKLLAMSQPVVLQPWFWILQGLPVLLFLGSVVWRRQQDQLEKNPRLRRRMEVRRSIQAGLSDLKHHCEAGRAEEFYATIFRLLQEQLGERLDMPPYAITEAVVDEKLPAHGASPELMGRLHHLFQLCNQARYAPAAVVGDMPGLMPELESAITDLQALPD